MTGRHNNLPENLYTAEQVRQLDKFATNQCGIDGFELMTRAAQAAFNELQVEWPDAQSIDVLCGGGNNGGDGYLVAMLAAKKGFKVQVCWLSSPDKLSGDALKAYEACKFENVDIQPFAEATTLTADVLVDAMLGTGLGRDVSGKYLQAVNLINQSGRPVLAVDIPSGLNADTGSVMGIAVSADLTVTFIGMKQGLLTGNGTELAGRVAFSDLNVHEQAYQQLQPSSIRLSEQNLSPLIKPRTRNSHKGDHGHLLLTGGNHGMPGAVIMAAEAAISCGAGKVTVATRQENLPALAVRRPEVMASSVVDGQALKTLLKNKTAIVIGPGLGRDDWAKKLLREALKAECPLVVDADALNLIADDPQLLQGRKSPMILTPHAGEAGRLLQVSSRKISENRVASVKELCRTYGSYCETIALLKGAGTLIYDGAELNLCSAGNPGMAVAGMGDVLSGVIGALLAQSIAAFDAARLGAWLHASAADKIAAQQGEIGLLATELIPVIRQQLNQLANRN
ncbi:bifunctional ADP-dependent NAD(P)H-hydrate dehydratase/NAD(P)H-hydrate epimerase [Endozoicomonas sp. OPT23]|uniref:NAD(P)H-hydrate dehydratase n=1 Tax=Endozoicomonas sp. OPT23 TaxID=2072845 RepID=UPI00129ADE02|nr:NAD(P)H-hydrate dehydratase [Endozoicomonas sp. OPT23]MRI31653.1 bifunctional ADP-dependent NAD(P)H-hydrate dehydratase/NAD(P)H-hydrate epimerase [Endozoicomonas sp. OPT23]